MLEPEEEEGVPSSSSKKNETTPLRRHSTSAQDNEIAQSSQPRRRVSLTQGLKDGGRKVVNAVESLFKDSRGGRIDLEDDPEYAENKRPIWEEDLKKYLPIDNFGELSDNGSFPSSSKNIISSSDNVASSSQPPMDPTTDPHTNAMNFLLGIKNTPHSLAATRWHKAYKYVKSQNALKKKALSTPIGTGAKLDGHALGLIPIEDLNRRSIFDFLYQSYPPTTLEALNRLIN